MSRIHRPGRMPMWQRWSVVIGLCVCMVSGVFFLMGHEFELVPKVLAGRAVLTVHGVSANLAVFLLGTVVWGHVRVGLSIRRQLFTGISNLIVMSILIASSWLLYYGSEDWRDNTVLIHWIVGGVFAVTFLAHLMPMLRGTFRSNHA